MSSSQPGWILVQAGPNQVVWFRERLTMFEVGWLKVTVEVDDDAPVGAMTENKVDILSVMNTETNYSNNEFVLAEQVLPIQPDLMVRKDLESGTVGGGNQISYRIHYRNKGGSLANNVRITDTLPLSTRLRF